VSQKEPYSSSSMASPPPGPSPSDGSKPAAPSLAAWKSGATKMTTSAAGDHVSKTAPKPQPKAAKVSKPAPSTRPWAEQSIAERYGTQPRKVNPNKQLKDALRYLEAQQDRGCITWEEIITQGIPPWYVESSQQLHEAGQMPDSLPSKRFHAHNTAACAGTGAGPEFRPTPHSPPLLPIDCTTGMTQLREVTCTMH